MRIRLATTIKLLGFALGSLMAVLMALTLLVWISFDAGRAAATLTQHFHERYDRNLKLANEPHLEIWPWPSLVLTGVTLSEPHQAGVFASASRVRAELALLPLLTRQLALRRLTIEAPQVRLRQNSDGAWNIADLFAPVTSSSNATPLRLNSLSLQEGVVKIENAEAAHSSELRQLNILANKLGDEAPSEISMGARWVDATGATDARLDLRTTALVREGLASFDALNARLEGNAFGLQGASFRATAGHGAWNKAANKGELSRASVHLTSARGPQSIEFNAELPALSWQESAWQGERSSAKLILRTPDEESTVAMEMGGLKDTDGKTTAQLNLKWENKTTALVGTGQFKGLLVIDAKEGQIGIDDFKGTARRIPLKGNRPGGETRLSGRAKWSIDGALKQPSILDLDFEDGADSLNLRARLDRLHPLSGTLKLDSQRLNADRIFTSANRDKLGAWIAPLATQAQLDAELNLRNLRLAGMRADALHSTMRIERGHVIATQVRLNLYGGSADFNANVELPAGKLAARGEYRGIDFDGLVHDSHWPFIFVGEQSGSFDVNTTHENGQANLAGLSGALRWTQKGGALQNIDLAQSLREFHAAIHNKSVIARQAGNRESTELDTASGRYVFRQGNMRAERIEASNKWLSLSGPGSVDLVRGEIDYPLSIRIKGGGKDIADLRATPLALHLLGPARKPQLHYEPTGKKATR